MGLPAREDLSQPAASVEGFGSGSHFRPALSPLAGGSLPCEYAATGVHTTIAQQLRCALSIRQATNRSAVDLKGSIE